jgi:hypothetical protein
MVNTMVSCKFPLNQPIERSFKKNHQPATINPSDIGVFLRTNKKRTHELARCGDEAIGSYNNKMVGG